VGELTGLTGLIGLTETDRTMDTDGLVLTEPLSRLTGLHDAHGMDCATKRSDPGGKQGYDQGYRPSFASSSTSATLPYAEIFIVYIHQVRLVAAASASLGRPTCL
jgi:hypothetical protein